MQRKQQTTFKQHHSCVTQQEGPAAALEPFSPSEDLLPTRRALKHHTTFSFLFSSSEGIHLLRYSPHPRAVSLQKHSFTEAGGNLTAEEQELAERSMQRCIQSTQLLGSNGFSQMITNQHFPSTPSRKTTETFSSITQQLLCCLGCPKFKEIKPSFLTSEH